MWRERARTAGLLRIEDLVTGGKPRMHTGNSGNVCAGVCVIAKQSGEKALITVNCCPISTIICHLFLHMQYLSF